MEGETQGGREKEISVIGGRESRGRSEWKTGRKGVQSDIKDKAMENKYAEEGKGKGRKG